MRELKSKHQMMHEVVSEEADPITIKMSYLLFHIQWLIGNKSDPIVDQNSLIL